MKTTLRVLGFLSFVLAMLFVVVGLWILAGSKSAIHEIEVGISWVIAGLCFVGATTGLGLAEIVDTLERGIEKQLARRPAPPAPGAPQPYTGGHG